MSELHPCPFCGGTKLTLFGDLVRCGLAEGGCGAQGPLVGQASTETKPEATRLWNDRPGYLVLEATDANSEDIAGQLEKVQDHAVKLEAALERANKYGAQADKDLERFLGIIAERKRQDDTWGVQDHPAPIWLAILTEEVGEVAKIILCMHCQEELPEELKDELTQVAAVAVAWLEKLEEADANAKTNS